MSDDPVVLYGVWCTVDNPLRGHREAWLTDSFGTRREFTVQADAVAEADRLSAKFDQAVFSYECREIPS